ncbi:MAG: cache domain-containing protein [Rubrivivax sp.]|nr:cache domain-containing protein [Rubrivivax sp.]
MYLLARRTVLSVAFACAFSSTAMAEDRGTRAEALALVEAGLAHVKKLGLEKAGEDFSKDKANWVKKDLYLFLVTLDTVTITANGGDARTIGKAVGALKDQNGKEFANEFVRTASTGKGEGWVDYDWLNPFTKKIEPKSSFVKKVPGHNYLIGVGIYR